jgi:hypothetical protein
MSFLKTYGDKLTTIKENVDAALYVFNFKNYEITVEKESLGDIYKIISKNKTNNVVKTKDNLQKEQIENYLKKAQTL